MDENTNIVRQAYNIIADKYDSDLSDYEIRFFSQFFDSFHGRNAIDLGCGQGRIAEYCHEKKGLDVLGCDISERMLEIAEKKNKYPKSISFVLSDMQKIASPTQFDIAIASFSFIHLTYSQAQITLRNLHGMLIDGGLIFISLLCGETCGYISDPLDPSVRIFVKQYTPNEITDLLFSSGYKTISINFGEDNDVAALSKEAMFVFASKEQMMGER